MSMSPHVTRNENRFLCRRLSRFRRTWSRLNLGFFSVYQLISLLPLTEQTAGLSTSPQTLILSSPPLPLSHPPCGFCYYSLARFIYSVRHSAAEYFPSHLGTLGWSCRSSRLWRCEMWDVEVGAVASRLRISQRRKTRLTFRGSSREEGITAQAGCFWCQR